MKKEIEEIREKDFIRESYPKEIYPIAVWGLILISILGVVGIIAITILAPTSQLDGLIALSSAAVGGIVGIFSQPRK